MKSYISIVVLIAVLLAPPVIFRFLPDYVNCKDCYQKRNPEKKEPSEYGILPPSILCFIEVADRHNGVIVAWGTIIIALFTATLWSNGGSQLKELRRSVDVLSQSERAVLHIVVGSNNFPDLMRGSTMYGNTPSMADGTVSTRGAISYRVKNYGKTPAVIREISHSIVCIKELLPTSDYLPIDIVLNEQMIASGELTEQIICRFNDLLKVQETNDVIRGQRSIWFYGRILYDDIFGQSHEHRFIWHYHGGTKGFRPYYKNNEYNKST